MSGELVRRKKERWWRREFQINRVLDLRGENLFAADFEIPTKMRVAGAVVECYFRGTLTYRSIRRVAPITVSPGDSFHIEWVVSASIPSHMYVGVPWNLPVDDMIIELFDGRDMIGGKEKLVEGHENLRIR